MVNDLKAYQQFIDQAISDYQLPAEPSNLYEPIRYILALDGKRMRPVLTLMACELFSEEFTKAKGAALAVELFHNFTLIHDDIMDKAPLRRGHKTVHKKWNENIGILSGDALFVEAFKNLVQYQPEIAVELVNIFNRTASEVCEGQQMDMDFEGRADVCVDEYIRMIRLKTAVLLGCSLEMGAIVGSANKQDATDLYNFGVNLGIAFQLQDDILDVYADASKFGKQVGGDIVANKKTFLLIEAFNRGSQEQVSQLNTLFRETDDKMKINGVMQVYEELNIRQIALDKMNYFYQSAMNSLDHINVHGLKKEPLKNLANYLLSREK